MSDSNKDYLCGLLHAYELGLLEGDQLDEFEVHLLDCPACRRQAEEFLPAAQLLKHDPEIRGLVEGLQAPEDEPKRRNYWPAVLAIAAAVIILVLRPWHLEFHPTQEAIASENRLAILYVGNPTESAELAGLGQTFASLLIADLSESQFLRVISSQRLYDAARHLGLPDPNRIDQSNAGAVAQDVGAKWMLTASLVSDGTQQRLVTQLFDVSSGVIEATQSATVDSSATIFGVVDNLSLQLKTDLGLPEQALKESDTKVADVTSHSVEAYRHYLKGIELSQRMYTDEATGLFYKAVTMDTAFAMAYYYLSLGYNPQMIQKAVYYSARATKKEQMLIAARAAQVAGDTTQTLTILQSITEKYPDEKDAFYLLGQYYFNRRDYSRAIFYFEKSLALDPLYRQSFNQLAYAYDNNGQLDEALRTLDDYQKIAPSEPNPLDSRGDILAGNGRLSEAIAAYAKAIEIEPGFNASKVKLYYAYLYSGQYELSDQIYREWDSACVGYGCANVYWAKASALVFRGQYRDGLTWMDKAIVADSIKSIKMKSSSLDVMYNAKAQMLLAMDSSALTESRRSLQYLLKMRPDDKMTFRITLARAFAQAGQMDSAAQVVEQLCLEIEAAKISRFTCLLAEGYLEQARGNAAGAAERFDSAATIRLKSVTYLPRYLEGQTLLEAGQADRATVILAAQENNYTESRTKDCVTSSKLYYYLGRAYEESGHPDSAIVKYDKFLSIWAPADPNLKEYTDARTRLARLKTTP